LPWGHAAPGKTQHGAAPANSGRKIARIHHYAIAKLTIWEGQDMDINMVSFITGVGVGAFLCGVALLYLVMNRTRKKRSQEVDA
jgi:hypothetical protein